MKLSRKPRPIKLSKSEELWWDREIFNLAEYEIVWQRFVLFLGVFLGIGLYLLELILLAVIVGAK